MAASKQDIESWLKQGIEQKARYVIVVCDTFDHEDYPVFIEDNDERFWKSYDEHYNKNMQRIMEVYDLKIDTQMQLAETRAFHQPPRPEKKA